MLDRLRDSPMLPLGFIVFVIFMVGIYFVNREKAQVQRLKGPRRFQPSWNRRGAEDSPASAGRSVQAGVDPFVGSGPPARPGR